MLPLLDIFMVVLFVFATIQEDRLDSSTEQVDALDAQLAEARLDAAQAQAQAEASDRARTAATQQLAQAEADAKKAAQQRPPVTASAADAVRQQDVLGKLLDHFTVFEVEVAGHRLDDGTIDNRCCYRSDPTAAAWQSCGLVPPRSESRVLWLESDGEPLLAALRRTKGGNAMVILRQDDLATYRIASHLDDLLRERFPDHHLYNDGVVTTPSSCTDAP
jgi:hypothetical protein